MSINPTPQDDLDVVAETAAFQAPSDLVFKGLALLSATTEPQLHAWRLKVKAGA